MKLLFLHFYVKFYEWREQRRVRKRFYQNQTYATLDQELCRGPNPYRIKEAFPYGETPLTSLQQIADRCGLSSRDRVIDLGCGRGRGVFFLAEHYGCHVVGIDQIGSFIKTAQELKERYRVSTVSFTQGDMRHCDLSQATCLFFYGSAYDDLFVADMTGKIGQLKPGTRVVSISYPIDGLELLDQFAVSFPWGVGEVFVCRVSHS